jgi:xanthine dehydrogenase accessory factor
MGWRIRVASCDPLKLEAPRFASFERHLLERPEALAKVHMTSHTRAVLMTHDLHFDQTALPILLAAPCRYVGLLGPRRRTARLIELLHEQQSLPSAGAFDKLAAPAGLDLGGTDPWQIGLAIVAEIVAHQHGRSGGALRSKAGSIHPPHLIEVRPIAEQAS